MLLDSLLRGVRDLRSRRLGAAGGRRCPSRAQGRLLRCEPLEERQLLSFDPGVSWATYLGGSDHDYGWGIAVDGAGNTLVAGYTSSSDFAGANNLYHGGCDAFVAKVKPDGSLAWVTYLGGSGDDFGLGIAVDGAGNVLVVGGTFSADFAGATPNSFHGGYYDAFVAKVDPDGVLAWATYLGGSGGEEGYGIAVDGAGNALVTGYTSSSDFAGANNSNHGGYADAFVAKVTSTGSFAWATYLGGSGGDAGYAIAVDGAGNALVSGGTGSSDFAGATSNSFHGGTSDAFVAKVTSGGSLAGATYLGGSGDDGGYGIAVDGDGNALVTGVTGSSDFEGANNLYHGGEDAFVAKVTSGGSLAGATYLGGTGAEEGNGIALDGAGNALVTGDTTSLDFEGANNAYHGGHADAFVVKLSGVAAISGPQAVVTPTSGLVTTEDGGMATFTVKLDTPPTANVTIPVSSSDLSEGTVSTSSLTFTSVDWNEPQTVTVTGLDDPDFDGNIAYTIVLDAATSDDPDFNGLNPTDVSVTNTDNDIPPTKFYVVNDASQDQTYEYAADGVRIESYGLNSGNTAPRGVASTIIGDKTWVVDANRKVYVYDTSGVLLGSWTAGSLASNATVEDITVCGSDVWIVDANSDKVFRYSGAAIRLKDSQNATSSFKLNSGNKNPKGIVTDGTSLWVVDDSTTDKVFKYTLSGSLVGSWTISTAGATSPTGLTIDPSGASQDIWIVDSGTDKVYQYANARSLTSGYQSAAATFALAAGNTNPQGIADPPAPGSMLATERRAGSLTDAALTAFVLYDFEFPSKPAPGKGLAMIPAIDLALAELGV